MERRRLAGEVSHADVHTVSNVSKAFLESTIPPPIPLRGGGADMGRRDGEREWHVFVDHTIVSQIDYGDSSTRLSQTATCRTSEVARLIARDADVIAKDENSST